MMPDLFWIRGPWAGRLAVSVRPRGGDWLMDEVLGWKNAGVHAIASFLEAEEAASLDLQAERDAVQAGGLDFLSFPIPDRSVPPVMGQAEAFVSAVRTRLERGTSVAMHCRQGVGRSGMMAVAVLVRTGLPVAAAVAAVGESRGVAVPETKEQMEWLNRFAAERSVVAA